MNEENLKQLIADGLLALKAGASPPPEPLRRQTWQPT